MIDGLASEDLVWLRAFFSPPNELHWDALANGTVSSVVAEQVRSLLPTLTDPESELPIILPFIDAGAATIWYAKAASADGGRELAAELEAWLGPTYLSLFEAVPDVIRDPMAAALCRRSQGVVWRFSGLDRTADVAIAKRLSEYVSLLGRRPKLMREDARPVGAIRGDFERALLATDARAAEGFIAELKATGRLNEENTRYLDVRLSAGLGLWPQIARDHWLIQTMSDLALPPQILADIVEALYRTHIDDIESAGDVAVTLAAFDANIAKRYPRLFASRRGIRTPRVVKAFLLFEQLQVNPSKQIIDELSAQLKESDRKRLSLPYTILEPEVITNPEAEAEEAFDNLQYDRAFVFYESLPLSKKNVGRMLACVQFIGTDAAREKMLAMIGEANPMFVASLSPEVRDKLSGLTTSTIEAVQGQDRSSDSESGDLAGVATSAPGCWMTWAEQLRHAENLPRAERVVEESVTNWDTSSFKTSDTQSRAFAAILSNLNDDATALARRSVPQVFESFFPYDEKPTKATKSIAEVLFLLVVLDESLSAQDLDILAQLQSILLTLGLSSEEYISLIADLEEVQKRVRSYTHLSWSLDVCEMLAVWPVPSEVARAARLDFFVQILGQAQAFAHRLGPQDLLPMELLANDFGVDPVAIDALRRPGVTNETATQLVDMSGKLIGIYTLAETAGNRAKGSLEKMFPGCTVEVNSDLVATEKLKNLARSASIFVFAWKSSTHAAFYCIKDELPNGEPVWAAGKGTASIMRAVLENLS